MFLLAICFSLLFTETFLLECNGLLFVLRIMVDTYKRHALPYTLNDLTTACRVFLEHQECFSPCWTEILCSKLSVSGAVIPLESADRHYHSSSLIFFSRCSLSEVRAIPGSFRNFTELGLTAFLMGSEISSSKKIGENMGELGMLWFCCSGKGSCCLLHERCCILKNWSSLHADTPILLQLGTRCPWSLAGAKQAPLSNALIYLQPLFFFFFSLVKINEACFRNFSQQERTWQKSPWLHSAVTWKNPVCFGACEVWWRRTWRRA